MREYSIEVDGHRVEYDLKHDEGWNMFMTRCHNPESRGKTVSLTRLGAVIAQLKVR